MEEFRRIIGKIENDNGTGRSREAKLIGVCAINNCSKLNQI